MLAPNHQSRNLTNPHAHCEIWLGNIEFNSWKLKMNELCLFFDGASKGNPRLARCGGVITEANGNVISRYAWGLGNDTNNKAEFCGLFQGLRIARDKGITKLLVFGDSRLLI